MSVPTAAPTARRPNQHDYDQLASIYAHLDPTTTTASTAATAAARGSLDERGEWGRRVAGSDGRGSAGIYERDFGRGELVVTVVFWA